MRIRVIVEDDEGKQIGEGVVPVAPAKVAPTVAPHVPPVDDELRRMMDDLKKHLDEEIWRRGRDLVLPYVPVYPQPYHPTYPPPWAPQVGDWPPFYKVWCSSGTGDPIPPSSVTISCDSVTVRPGGETAGGE